MVLEAEEIHSSTTCDGCGSEGFSGIRYKCTICHDYDLCQICYESKTYKPFSGHVAHDSSHKMTSIKPPSKNLARLFCYARAKKLQDYVGQFLSKRDYDKFDLKTEQGRHDIDRKIGFALYGAPSREIDNAKNCYYGYSVEQEDEILKIRKWLRAKDAEHHKDEVIWLNFVFISYFQAEKFEGTLVLFKQAAGGKTYFMEPSGRTYTEFEDFLDKNKLPECRIVYPVDGKYTSDEHNQTNVDSRLSAECDTSRKVARAADISVGITGLGASIVGGILCFTPLAPVGATILTATAIATTPYGVSRAAYNLYDRGSHDENINPFDNRESFFNWLSIVSAGASAGAMGCTAYLSSAALTSAEIGATTRIFMNSAIFGNLGLQGVGVVAGVSNLIYKLTNDEEVSGLEWLQVSASVFFFTSAVVNAKTAGKIIDQARAQEFSKIRASLPEGQQENFDAMLQKNIVEKGSVTEGGQESIKQINELKKNGELRFQSEKVVHSSNHANRHANELGHKTLYKQGGEFVQFATDKAAIETAERATAFRAGGIKEGKTQLTTVFKESPIELDARVARAMEDPANVRTNVFKGKTESIVTLPGKTFAKNIESTRTNNQVIHKITETFIVNDVQVAVDENGHATHLYTKAMNKATFDSSRVELIHPTGNGQEKYHVYVCGIYSTDRNTRERSLWNFEWLEDQD